VARRVGRSRSSISNLIRLLDLPDPVIEMLESEALSEGHGRALLATKSQDRRRSLARQAVAEGWSVRETERRAKGEGGDAARKARELHPDEEAAIGKAEDALERALGHDVRVRSGANGLTAQIRFTDLDEVLALTKALRRK
jgi:ParB family chromosome partitioning protein